MSSRQDRKEQNLQKQIERMREHKQRIEDFKQLHLEHRLEHLNQLHSEHRLDHLSKRLERKHEREKRRLEQFQKRMELRNKRIQAIGPIPRRRAVLNFILGAILVSVCFTASAVLFPKIFEITGRPGWFFPQIITSIGGLFIMGTFLSILGRYFNHIQNEHMVVHTHVLEDVKYVIDSIALGNTNIKVKHNSVHNREPLYDLVTSVNKMVDEIGTMEKMRQDFVSNVSHEIQSPLTSIRGFAQLLRNPEISSEDRKQYLDIIESESRRLSNLSDNLLKLSTLESEKRVVELQEFSLDHQIQQVILSCEPQWAGKQIELDVSLNKVLITADRDLLSQVWLNLLHNAIKFTPLGGSIQLSLAYSGDFAVFNISDSGVGIIEEEKIHIFERFYKGDKSRNREKGGNGLGLAIVKKILDLHGGEIMVESELGKGTTFTVRLPLQ